jgi:hypothetical protein
LWVQLEALVSVATIFCVLQKGIICEKQRNWEFLKTGCKWMSLYKLAAFLLHNWRIKNLYLDLGSSSQDFQVNRWSYTLHKRVSQYSWSMRVEYQIVIQHRYTWYEKTNLNAVTLCHTLQIMWPILVSLHTYYRCQCSPINLTESKKWEANSGVSI